MDLSFNTWIKRKINIFVLKGKPPYATAKGWREWNQTAKKEQPIAYWLNEIAADYVKDTWRNYAVDPVVNFRYAIRHRFFDRYNVIHTGLKPGYYDADIRMLNGMFNLLVDFIEIEKAWMHVVFDDTEHKKRNHPWWSKGWTRFKSFRDPDAGLAHLNWEIGLGDPDLPEHEQSSSQAADAKEELELYNWWKYIRPNRPDAYDSSGWSAYCATRRSKSNDTLDFLDHEDESDEERENVNVMLDKIRKIEQDYDNEDQEMLIRLIKIRKGMWT